MLRRTLLQTGVGFFFLRPARALARILQAPPFSIAEIETLSAVAEVVLPSDLSAQERKRAVDRFVAWFVNYRQGADMGHGYGAATLRQPSGPSPVTRYPPQFAALANAARERGGATFAALPAASRREVVEKILNEPQPVNRLPAQPTGASLIADLMGSYFTSADAWDRCYRAEIQRDNCRTLDNSAEQPRPIQGGRVFRPGMSMQRHECDVLIIGGGITAALVAQKLAERRPSWTVIVVEAGKRLFDFENRMDYRERSLDYGENQWPGDFVADQSARGIISRTMAVGGSALHWGGVCNRFSEEDTRLKSMYGLAVDWPIEWKELERYYCEAERRIGVSGEPSPLPEDWRSEPYPMKAMPMTWNLIQLKAWAEKSGIKFWTTPQAKNTVEGYDGRGRCRRCNTCEICPTGARYSPDWTFKKLLEGKNFQLHDQTLVRKLALEDSGARIAVAHASREDETGAAVEYRARTFILASGYCWSPHLLLASANSRFPNGLANSSDHVGRHMTGHLAYQTTIDLDARIFPGMNEQHSLISRQFFRCKTDQPYVRHDLRVWENAGGRGPQMRDGSGKLLLGDAVMADWRSRTTRGTARVRGYYDVHPDKDSRLTLDPATKNRFGDPMPVIQHRVDAATQARAAATREHFQNLFAALAKANDGRAGQMSGLNYQDHPAGGCRMGADPSTSVVDSHGRTHDHENLFVVGSPTLPTGGCTNGTLTFLALAVRSVEEIAK